MFLSVKFPDFPKKNPYLREPALEAMLRKLIGVVTVVCSYGREWENGPMIHRHWLFFQNGLNGLMMVFNFQRCKEIKRTLKKFGVYQQWRAVGKQVALHFHQFFSPKNPATVCLKKKQRVLSLCFPGSLR